MAANDRSCTKLTCFRIPLARLRKADKARVELLVATLDVLLKMVTDRTELVAVGADDADLVAKQTPSPQIEADQSYDSDRLVRCAAFAIGTSDPSGRLRA